MTTPAVRREVASMELLAGEVIGWVVGVGGLVVAALREIWSRSDRQRQQKLEEEQKRLEKRSVTVTEFEKLAERLTVEVTRLDAALREERNERQQEQRDAALEQEAMARTLAQLRRGVRRLLPLFRALQDHVRYREVLIPRWFPDGRPVDLPEVPPGLLDPIDDLIILDED